MTISRKSCLAMLVLLALAGCGRRGPLEPPPEAGVPKAAIGADGKAETPSFTPAPSKGKKRRVPINVPKDPFFLDPIL